MANNLYVKIGHCPYNAETPHRFASGGDPMTSTVAAFGNCRMETNNTIIINIGTVSYDTLRSCNYLSYTTGLSTQNQKTYYCFITKFDYINDTACAVSFDVDNWATWSNNITLRTSFINRISPLSKSTDFRSLPDTVENIGVGESSYVGSPEIISRDDISSSYTYVVGVTNCIPYVERLITAPEDRRPRLDYTNLSVFPSITSSLTTCAGISQGCVYYLLDSLNDVSHLLGNAVDYGYTSAVTGLWKVPSIIKNNSREINCIYYGGKSETEQYKAKEIPFSVTVLDNSEGLNLSKTISIPNVPKSGDYYGKCFSSQFYKIHVQSLGIVKEFNPYVLAPSAETIDFYIYYDYSPDMSMYIIPSSYAGYGQTGNWFEAVNIPIALQGSLSADNVNNFYRQANIDASNKIVSQTISSITSVTGAYTSYDRSAADTYYLKSGDKIKYNAVGSGKHTLMNAASSAVAGTGSIIANGVDYLIATRQPDYGVSTVVGNGVGCLPLQIPSDKASIIVGWFGINDNDLERVNEYFKMWGYNYNQAMEPYLECDTNQCFVQGDVNFYGNIPSDAIADIKSMFVNGVTFWQDGTMYNYN